MTRGWDAEGVSDTDFLSGEISPHTRGGPKR
jgi:hypothetical protein